MALADSTKAIGAVSKLLRLRLSEILPDVTVGKPEDAATISSNPRFNLFLYEAVMDPQLRNFSLREGEPPPLWLVLKFLLTAFEADGSDTAAAHELLGAGLAALQALSYLRPDPAAGLDVQLALENNPEPLKITFDEPSADLLGKIMQGTDERYRLSIAFQVRPVMIVPAKLPRAALLVGVDYSTTPQTIIGKDGVHIEVIPSLGARLDRAMPDRFEIGNSLTLFGTDLSGGNIEVVLSDVLLTITQVQTDRLVVIAEAASGASLASGTRLSAGELPLIVRRRLSPTRTRSSNLLAARLLPTLQSAALVAGNLQLQGQLLGTDSDDVIGLLCRESDGATVRMFDTFLTAPNQQSLTAQNATVGLPADNYRLVLRVNNQQAKASPQVVVP